MADYLHCETMDPSLGSLFIGTFWFPVYLSRVPIVLGIIHVKNVLTVCMYIVKPRLLENLCYRPAELL